MRIAFDISPLSSGHKYRGTGFYTLHLKEAFEKYFATKHEFVFFSRQVPSNVDLVHYPYFDPFSNSVPLLPKIPTIVTVLDLTPILFPKLFKAGIKGSIMWQRQKFALQHIAGIMTDSLSAKHDIEKIVGLDESKIGMAYLAAGENFKKISNIQYSLSNIKKKYHLPEKFALYVGDVTRNKNVPRLIKAAIKANIPLVLAGKAFVNTDYDKLNPWNKDLVEVQELIKEKKDIIALGFVPDEDLVALYNYATISVMPSLYEGFGLPVLEAMACGSPVVTSKEGSLPEVAGESAYYVDPYSEESIALGMKNVFSDFSLQKEFKKKGLNQIKKFSWRKTAEETLTFYEKILAKK